VSNSRLDDLFLVLKVIRRAIDGTNDLATNVLRAAACDRQSAGEWCDRRDVAALSELCRRLIDEREALAMSLEAIRLAIAVADIVPRTHNMGPSARSASKPRRPI
jgi:hypothetical protein